MRDQMYENIIWIAL